MHLMMLWPVMKSWDMMRHDETCIRSIQTTRWPQGFMPWLGQADIFKPNLAVNEGTLQPGNPTKQTQSSNYEIAWWRKCSYCTSKRTKRRCWFKLREFRTCRINLQQYKLIKPMAQPASEDPYLILFWEPLLREEQHWLKNQGCQWCNSSWQLK